MQEAYCPVERASAICASIRTTVEKMERISNKTHLPEVAVLYSNLCDQHGALSVEYEAVIRYCDRCLKLGLIPPTYPARKVLSWLIQGLSLQLKPICCQGLLALVKHQPQCRGEVAAALLHNLSANISFGKPVGYTIRAMIRCLPYLPAHRERLVLTVIDKIPQLHNADISDFCHVAVALLDWVAPDQAMYYSYLFYSAKRNIYHIIFDQLKLVIQANSGHHQKFSEWERSMALEAMGKLAKNPKLTSKALTLINHYTASRKEPFFRYGLLALSHCVSGLPSDKKGVVFADLMRYLQEPGLAPDPRCTRARLCYDALASIVLTMAAESHIGSSGPDFAQLAFNKLNDLSVGGRGKIAALSHLVETLVEKEYLMSAAGRKKLLSYYLPLAMTVIASHPGMGAPPIDTLLAKIARIQAELPKFVQVKLGLLSHKDILARDLEWLQMLKPSIEQAIGGHAVNKVRKAWGRTNPPTFVCI